MAEDTPDYVEKEDLPKAMRLKLEKAIDKSYSDLDTLRNQRMMLLEEYNTNIDNRQKTVINKLYQMIDTYQRLLSSSQPNVMVGTIKPDLEPDAENLRLAINHLMEEIRFSKNLNRAVLDGLFGMAIMKTGLGRPGLPKPVCLPFARYGPGCWSRLAWLSWPGFTSHGWQAGRWL